MKSKVIHKHIVDVDDDDHSFQLAADALPIHAGPLPNGTVSQVQFWEMHDEAWLDKRPHTRVFRIFGTGQVIPPGYDYWFTIPIPTLGGGQLVWHLFEKRIAAEIDRLERKKRDDTV